MIKNKEKPNEIIASFVENRVFLYAAGVIAVMVILVAYMVLRETRSTVTEIENTKASIEEKCRPIFQMKLQSIISEEMRPIEADDIEEVAEDVAELLPSDCEIMIQQYHAR